ncbi:hypothetical protein ADUPG1_008658, partial [Aduncisulcus paluster]
MPKKSKRDTSSSYVTTKNAEGKTTAVTSGDDSFLVGHSLGKGMYGTVRYAIRKEDGREFALKILNKSYLKKYSTQQHDLLDTVFREIAVLQRLDHPHICNLYKVIQSPTRNRIFLVLELCEGKIANIKEFIHNNTLRLITRPQPLQHVRKIIRSLAKVLKYLESMGLIHGDIKPSNIMIGQDDKIKLVDFSLVSLIGKPLNFLSSPAFQAPEVIKGERITSISSEVWSMGITIFLLVFGVHPFEVNHGSVGDDVVEMLKQSMTVNKLVFPAPCPPFLKDLLSQMLEKNPAKRITPGGILKHPFVMEPSKSDDIKYTPADGPPTIMVTDSSSSTPSPASTVPSLLEPFTVPFVDAFEEQQSQLQLQQQLQDMFDMRHSLSVDSLQPFSGHSVGPGPHGSPSTAIDYKVSSPGQIPFIMPHYDMGRSPHSPSPGMDGAGMGGMDQSSAHIPLPTIPLPLPTTSSSGSTAGLIMP